MPDTAIHAEAAVRARYAKAAQGVQQNLCCAVPYDSRYLKAIPAEVIERDYGCGDPSAWAREGETHPVLDPAWAWLDACLDTPRLRALLPEVAPLEIERHRLPALRSLNFVIHGLLEEGVAASTRQDPQAKGLGEWLRARYVELPKALLP